MTRSLPELNRNPSRKNCEDELVKLIGDIQGEQKAQRKGRSVLALTPDVWT